MITQIINFFVQIYKSYKEDPVRHCAVYKDIDNGSCSHVDGFLCNMKTCNILKEYNKSITNVDFK
jgi:hypothetical protein